jgi:hypothetical protein
MYWCRAYKVLNIIQNATRLSPITKKPRNFNLAKGARGENITFLGTNNITCIGVQPAKSK